MDEATMLAIGAAIFGVVEILRRAFPSLQTERANLTPLIVLVLAGAAVAGGYASGEIDGKPLALALAVVSQAVSALGIRQGIVAVANSPVVPDAVAKQITGTTASGTGR